jgi:hypothetical protein
MKRLLSLTLAALFCLAASAMAGPFAGHCCQPQCITPPGPNCPDCSCPCDHGLHISLASCEQIEKLIGDLHACSCCERIRAARRLGHHLIADFCNNPEVLDALINALQCDPCWEVRDAAAWAIMKQKARTEKGVLALYIASKLDPHYIVRADAAEALDILTLGHKECFTDTIAGAGNLINELKKQGYKPGSANCSVIIGAAPGTPTPAPAGDKKVDAGVITPIPAAELPARLPSSAK